MEKFTKWLKIQNTQNIGYFSVKEIVETIYKYRNRYDIRKLLKNNRFKEDVINHISSSYKRDLLTISLNAYQDYLEQGNKQTSIVIPKIDYSSNLQETTTPLNDKPIQKYIVCFICGKAYSQGYECENKVMICNKCYSKLIGKGQYKKSTNQGKGRKSESIHIGRGGIIPIRMS